MLDLFGDVPVTIREVELWLFKVPKFAHDATRRAAYVKAYNVVDKIKRSKLNGWWLQDVQNELCDHCGAELAPVDCWCPARPSDELLQLRRRVAVLEMLLIPPKEKPGLVSRAGAVRGRVTSAF